MPDPARAAIGSLVSLEKGDRLVESIVRREARKRIGIQIKDAEIEEGLGIIGTKRERPPERCLGVGPTTLRSQRGPAVEVGLGKVGSNLERVVEARKRGLGVARFEVPGTEVVPGGGVAFVGFGGFAEGLRGLVRLIRCEKGKPLEVVSARGVLGAADGVVDCERARRHGLGEFELSLPEKHLGEDQHRIRVLLVELERLTAQVDGVAEALGEQHLASFRALAPRRGQLPLFLLGIAILGFGRWCFGATRSFSGRIGGLAWTIAAFEGLAPGSIGLWGLARRCLGWAGGEREQYRAES